MFKYVLGVLFAGLIGIPGLATADTTPRSSLGPEELDVIQAEEAWVEAELNNDEAMLRNVIDDRFVFNSNNGTTSGKEELIESARAWNMTGQHITERTVLVDGDMALIFGTTELRFAAPDGEETVSLLRYTSTYVKRGTQWRAIALHMARRTTDE
jgi:ketosteroid isomerase-like protein